MPIARAAIPSIIFGLSLFVARHASAQQPADVTAAMDRVRAQANGGSAVAQFSLGVVLYFGADELEQATTLIRKAAEQGYGPAEYQLAQMHDFGFVADASLEQALSWYRKAAAQGVAPAQRRVGDFYRIGRVVTEDLAEAARWYRMAADRDDIRAQVQLGQMCLDGSGVPRDNVSAYLWFAVAVTQTPIEDNRRGIIELRNLARVRMTPEQLAEAMKRVADWKPVRWGTGTSTR